MIRTILVLSAAALSLAAVSPARGLEPEQIALVVNQNVPAGLDLARFYAEQRHIPADRIISIPLPDTDEIPFDAYDRDIVPAVRRFLRDRHLESQVKCLVTFWGMPLRIAGRIDSPTDLQERQAIGKELADSRARLEALIVAAERSAAEVDPAFTPAPRAAQMQELSHRAGVASESLFHYLATTTSTTRSTAISTQLDDLIHQMGGLASGAGGAEEAGGVGGEQGESRREILQARFQAVQLQERRFDPAARKALRELVQDRLGLFDYVEVLQSQEDYLQTDRTVSALDNELALLWWPSYSRVGWQFNPLNLHSPATPHGAPPTLMVMRLDAPDAQRVRQIILDSIQTESQGLIGQAVLDSRGIPPHKPGGAQDAYGRYDQSIRDLGQWLRSNTKLKVFEDDQPEVLPAGSASDVALYCGWYSLRHYVPACKFNRGAVGFHIASSELVRLHNPRETGWVHGLLNDGVVATLGPVAEPYLQAFPRPDEFFPLLLTGKLTLAEVVWKTTPLTSWMISVIGDPLYNPYRSHPAVDVQKLPPDLRAAVGE